MHCGIESAASRGIIGSDRPGLSAAGRLPPLQGGPEPRDGWPARRGGSVSSPSPWRANSAAWPWPTPTQSVARPRRASRRRSSCSEADDQPRAAHPERVPDCDRAAVDVDPLRVEAELADHREALRGEGLVELDQVDAPRPPTPVRASSLRTAGIGPTPITRGSTPAAAEPTKRASGCTAEPLRGLRRGDHERGGAVVDTGWSCRP